VLARGNRDHKTSNSERGRPNVGAGWWIAQTWASRTAGRPELGAGSWIARTRA
jgi:hypothetical protein